MKNFATATRFIVAVLHTKIDAMSDLKSNSTLAKQITSGHHISTRLMVIYSVGIPSMIIRVFSRNLN